MRRLKFAIFGVLITSGCASADRSRAWHPPQGGVITDASSAIRIARAIWLSAHPELKDDVADERTWQSGMIATLHEGVWEIVSKELHPNEIGGRVFIYLSKEDARVIDISITH